MALNSSPPKLAPEIIGHTTRMHPGGRCFNSSLVVPKVAQHTNPALKVHEIVDLYGRLVGKSMPYMDPMGFESPAGHPPRKINTRQKSKNPADILLNA